VSHQGQTQTIHSGALWLSFVEQARTTMVENISSSAVASSVSGTEESSSPRRRHHQKQHRKPPRDAILDPTYLRDRLDLSERHLSAFYLALHQQNYPATLREFLAVYHHEKDDIDIDEKDDDHDDDDADSSIAITSPSSCSPPSGDALRPAEQPPEEPMNNGTIKADQHRQKMMNKKKKKKNHKIQLPKRFLEFLNNIAACDDDAADDDGTKKNKSNNSDAASKSRLLLTTSHVHSVQHSANTLTTKLIIQLHDGMLIESVIMRYDQKTTIPRASLCVSSQVGCAMGCTFCATGTMGKIGNLGVAEILEQVIHANRILRMEPGRPSVRNVVFMGMGEVRLRIDKENL
jgi:hypothetical protein